MSDPRSVSIVHFNARSVGSKWDEICADMQAIDADIYCISETWIKSPEDLALFSYKDYIVVGNCRPNKTGGGVMILVNPNLRPTVRANSSCISPSNGYNICSIKLQNTFPYATLVTVYRPPNATAEDTHALFRDIRAILKSTKCAVVVGDFNIIRDWNAPLVPVSSGAAKELVQLMLESDLIQLNLTPSRGDNILDLVFVSSGLSDSTIQQLPPVAGSDHLTQLLYCALRKNSNITNSYDNKPVINFKEMNRLLSQVHWPTIFRNCRDIDDFVATFMNQFTTTVANASQVQRRRKFGARNLPKFIVNLIHKKQAMWRHGKASGDFSAYKQARNAVRAAINNHKSAYERTLLHKGNKAKFFKYINASLGKKSISPIAIIQDDTEFSGEAAANILNDEFCKNFNDVTDNVPTEDIHSPSTLSDEGLQFNCTMHDIKTALHSCSNSAAGPDGISFAIIKSVAPSISYPLLIIYQQSLKQGKFPTMWKHAKIVPIFKGKGSRTSADSYRPVSLCSCFGKLLEKIIKTQLESQIDKVAQLSSNQYGFRAGRSTVSNLLSFDSVIAEYINNNESFDIITFDFKRAFDKVPHIKLINVLTKLKLHKNSFNWISSFLSGRSQTVVLNDAVSRASPVTSGTIQGSVIGVTLFTLYIDSLLHLLTNRIPNLSFAFADDVKFVTKVDNKSYETAKTAVNIVNDWSLDHQMPLSIDKCLVLHCGMYNPRHSYSLGHQSLPASTQFKDLGVLRCTSSRYNEHIAHLSASGLRLAGIILRTFRSRDYNLLWSAFNAYVKPKLIYASPVWSPIFKYEISMLERVQRRFSKWLPELSHLTYEQRLTKLNAISLEATRNAADMIFIFRCIHHLHDVTLENVGLSLSNNNNRSGKLRLNQPIPRNLTAKAMFKYRAISLWNALPDTVTCAKTITNFKSSLYIYFNQCRIL